MDQVYNPSQRPWISSQVISLRSQLDAVKQRMQSISLDIQVDSAINDQCEIDFVNSLEEFACSNEELVKPNFFFNSTDERTIVESQECMLNIYRLQADHAKQMIADREYRINYILQLKTTRREILMRQLASMSQPHQSSRTIQSESIVPIVVVQLWRQPSKQTRVKLEKEILFAPDGCLTELRDKIKCTRDFVVPMDLSVNPDKTEKVLLGEMFKSGFFLIGKTFYNDSRDPNNTDLSSDIINWASKEIPSIDEDGHNIRVSRGVGPFEKRKMEESEFYDLEFRLGCPYLYLHQGDCEHLFTISDIRYTKNIPTQLPLVTAASLCQKNNFIKCYMCKNRPPHWYTRNNSRVPVDPFFFCEKCFYSFNYTSNGEKLGQFQAYLYTGSQGIPESVTMAQ